MLQNLRLLLLAMVFALPMSAQAIYFAGTKSAGMAGAVSANPLDAFYPAYNPAGGVLVSDRLDVGFDWSHRYQRASFRNVNSGASEGSFNGAIEPAKAFAEVGFNKTFRFCLGRFPVDVSIGAAYFTRTFLSSEYRTALATNTPNADDGNQQAFLFGTSPTAFEYLHQVISPSLAVRICDKHTIGVAVNYNIQKLNVKGFEERTTPLTIATTDASAFSNRGDDYSHGVGVTVGYLCQLNRCLRLAAAFEPETSMDRFNKYRGFVADSGKFDLPWRVRAGLGYQFSPTLALAFDYEYVNWSSVPMLGNNVKTIEVGTISYLLDIDRPFGSKKGPGFGWMGQSIYRFGFNWQALRCLAIRFGFEHANTPYQDRKSLLNTVTMNNLENTFTVGSTYSFHRCHEISAFFGMGLEHSLFGKDSFIVTSPDGDVLEAVDVKKSMFALGFSWGFKF